MSWGGILHNALNDTKGLVDPRTYYKTGKFAVEHPLGFTKAVGQSYLDLAKHPVRTLENHPVDTLLQFAPVAGGVGKLADIGAEAGALKVAGTLDKAQQGGAATFLRKGAAERSAVPGVRALRTAKTLGAVEKQFWGDLKYHPGKGGGIVDQPGITTDRGLLSSLHKELGSPNTNYFTDYATPVEQGNGTGGTFLHNKQEATALAHPAQFIPGQETSAADLLTKTMLHEARHGFQKATWSRPQRLIDMHRPYGAQRMEQDANAFSESALPRYKGLITADPTNPRIPPHAQPTIKDFGRVAKTDPALAGVTDYHGLEQVVEKIHGGLTGQPSEEQILNHMDALVKTGQLSRQEAIDLQIKLADNPYETTSYGMHNDIGKALDDAEHQGDRRATPRGTDRRFLKPMNQAMGESYKLPRTKDELLARALAAARSK